MYESYHGLDFGLGPVAVDDWVHQRVQFMSTLRHGDALEVVSELTWGHMWGKESTLAPPDQDDVDILQLHLQGRIPVGADALEFRAGRQTLYYGSGRLLAAREGANQRLVHDAFRLSWLHGNDTRVDAFIASPVQVRADAFDNESEPQRVRFWSLYAVVPLGRGHFADLYYIGLRDEDSIFAEDGGEELRHTLGIRNWNKAGPLAYNTELILQFGEAGGREILAGAASLGITYEFTTVLWRPTPQLRADAVSGGNDSGNIHSFHPLFQANNYFNEGGFVAPSNIYNLNPLLALHPHEDVEISLGVNFQWLFSRHDAVYGPPLQPLAQPDPAGGRYIGTAFNASIGWEFLKGISVFFGYTHHHAGSALTGIGGRSANYVQASFRWEF